jgi:Tfp pilus assembly protein PilX
MKTAFYIKRALKNSKGFTLVLALVMMFVMTIIGLSVILNMTSEISVSRNEKEAKLAFQIAEAGLQEGLARIKLPSANANYRGEPSGTVDPRNTAWSTTFSSSEADMDYDVTVEYLLENNVEGYCDSNNTAPNNSGNSSLPPFTCNVTTPEVVMYGQDFGLDSTMTYLQHGTFPVYKITSTGTAGTGTGTTRVIEAYVGASSLNLDSEYPINVNGCVEVDGAAVVIDLNVMQGAGCACDPQLPVGCLSKASDTDLTTYLGLPVSEIKAMADEVHYCVGGANCTDVNDDVPSSGQIDDVVQDWGDFATDSYAQYIYIDNPGAEVVITSNQTGRGLLLVTGDLRISGGFDYEGLIYVLGTLTISGGGGGVNVTGGIMAETTVDLNGSINVNYDYPTLYEISKQNSAQSMILWKKL